MAFKLKETPYPKRKVTWGTDESGNVVKTITRGKGSDTASRTVTYSQETGKKLGKHREAGFGRVSGHIFGQPVGGEKTVDFSKGRGLGKTMVTKEVGEYTPADPSSGALERLYSWSQPSGTKTVTATRGQMIKKGAKSTAKSAIGLGLSYPAIGVEGAKFIAQHPKETARFLVEGTAALGLASVALPALGVQYGLQKIQGGIEKVGKKIGSKVKDVATKVRTKRLAKKTK